MKPSPSNKSLSDPTHPEYVITSNNSRWIRQQISKFALNDTPTGKAYRQKLWDRLKEIDK